jgi:uncharacterized protein YndB with AHSA1/START domain
MLHEVSVDIDASPERVWSVLMDVERWPEWTASMTKVERLDAGDLAVGARVRIRQPRLPVVVWQVSALEPGGYFAWSNKSPGASTVAGHRVAPNGAGSRVTLSIDQRGWIVPILRLFFGGLTRRYVEMEANGLKAAAEAG